MGHALKNDKSADFMWHKLADYIIKYYEPVTEVTGEYLSRKGQTLKGYYETTGKQGWWACPAHNDLYCCNSYNKNGVWSTFVGDVSDAELVLVYLGKSVVWDTIPMP